MDLVSRWSLNKLDQNEFLSVVLGQFSAVSQPAPNCLTYETEFGSYALKIQFTNAGTIHRIEPGPQLTTEVMAKIDNAVKQLLAPGSTMVYRRALTCSARITRPFGLKQFQLLPLPETAPACPYEMGDHPLILEFPVETSADLTVNVQRVSAAANRIVLLLCGLCDGSFRELNKNTAFQWITLPDSNEPIWAQQFYNAEGLFAVSDAFTPNNETFAGESSSRLFGDDTREVGASWRVRDDLPELLDRVEELTLSDQASLLRSCYWIQQANRNFGISPSLSFACLTAACEALFDEPKDSTCVTCGQRKAEKSLTSLFAEFIAAHAMEPASNVLNMGEKKPFVERLKELYGRRSKIVHGQELTFLEMSGGWTFAPIDNVRSHDLRTFHRILPFALGSWIRSRCIK